MASPLQQASVRRKVIYAGVIVALFTVSIFWRGKLDVPFGNSARAAEAAPTGLNRVADAASRRAILAQAQQLDLRELDQGDAEVAGSAVRLSLLGSRGIMITILWRGAIEKQKRNEFHEFEILVRAVTRLQPNFITPWIFQSWNIAYNVSVENDKLGDMYFYIARGIELLADGDRLNTKVDRRPNMGGRKVGSPDIRFQTGFYYQNKFGVSDKVQTLRSLMQLSCIPPGERSAAAFRPSPGQPVDPEAFRRFCEKNPQLVRRLRYKLACTEPEDVLQFLLANSKIPTLYKNDTELADDASQFPVLPPRFEEGPDEYYPGRPVDDTFDAFLAARAWFTYALTVVPKPTREYPPTPEHPDGLGDPIPWAAPSPDEYDQFAYRVPRSPSLIIFRQQAPRAQAYLADRLAKEGWFDETSSWNPGDDSAGAGAWPAVPLRAGTSSKEQWATAALMWRRHGQDNALIWGPGVRERLEEAAGGRAAPPNLPYDITDDELAAIGLTRRKVRAMRALAYYPQNRAMTNFPYFLATSEAEAKPVTVEARKRFWEAEEAEKKGGLDRVNRLYVEALTLWREVLRTNPDFHRPERSDANEEETHEKELALVNRLKEDGGVLARADRVARAAAALHPALIEVAKKDYVQVVAEDEALTRVAVETMLRTLPTARSRSDDERRALELLYAGSEAAAALAPAAAAAAPDQVQAAVARSLVAGDYWWLKEFRERPVERNADGTYERMKYWVVPYLRDAVKSRLGLIRRSPPSYTPEQEAMMRGERPGTTEVVPLPPKTP